METKYRLKFPCLLAGLLFSFVLFYPAMTPCSEEQSFKDISAPEVKHLLDRGQAKLYNVLSEIEYDMQHITGSINIPSEEISTTDKLPEDKDTTIIFYCMGTQ